MVAAAKATIVFYIEALVSYLASYIVFYIEALVLSINIGLYLDPVGCQMLVIVA